MVELRNRIQEIQSKWDQVYEIAQQSPELWEQHYLHLSAEQVNSLVSSLGKIFDRVRAPSGYSAGFDLAKASAYAVIPNIEPQLDNLVALQFNHIRSFVVQLNQLFSASLTLLVVGNITDRKRLLASLGAEVTEVAHRAKEDMKGFRALYEELRRNGEGIAERQRRIDSIDESLDELDGIAGKFDGAWEEVSNTVEAIKAEFESVEATVDILTERESRIGELEKGLLEARNELDATLESSKEIGLKINGLLPGAASVGLAAAFEARADKLVSPKTTWLFFFILSIAGMICVAFTLNLESEELWRDAMSRIPFVAPLVWLGWFSAIQYGNTVRLEEDYRFKSSTARAFVGYRDHMRHLKDVDLENADSVLALLSARTVEILSAEPGRLLGKASSEASPSSSWSELRDSMQARAVGE